MQIQGSASLRGWELPFKYARAYPLLSFVEISIEHARRSERVCLNHFVATVNHFIRYPTEEQNEVKNIIVLSNNNE